MLQRHRISPALDSNAISFTNRSLLLIRMHGLKLRPRAYRLKYCTWTVSFARSQRNDLMFNDNTDLSIDFSSITLVKFLIIHISVWFGLGSAWVFVWLWAVVRGEGWWRWCKIRELVAGQRGFEVWAGGRMIEYLGREQWASLGAVCSRLSVVGQWQWNCECDFNQTFVKQ